MGESKSKGVPRAAKNAARKARRMRYYTLVYPMRKMGRMLDRNQEAECARWAKAKNYLIEYFRICKARGLKARANEGVGEGSWQHCDLS